MKRTAISRGVARSFNSSLRAVSPKGVRARSAWAKRKKAVAHDPCALSEMSACWGRQEAHHVRVKGMGGVTVDDSPIVSLCAGHHAWTHDHPAKARELGLIEKRR